MHNATTKLLHATMNEMLSMGIVCGALYNGKEEYSGEWKQL
jgi:hypothetical protein